MPRRQSEIEDLIQTILGDEYLNLHVESYRLEEQVKEDTPCEVTATLFHEHAPDNKLTIAGKGVGFIDALYQGMLDHYAKDFPSLNTICFTGFSVSAKMATSQKKGADAEGVVSLTATNSNKREFEFEESGRSVVAATIDVVVQALEYFINSERAFLSVHRALEDARNRKRQDLIQAYTGQLSQLVHVTSYSDVIEEIRASEL